MPRHVSIFDADLPTGLAFARSLGRAGVPIQVYSDRRRPITRFSRFVRGVRPCPALSSTDEFIDWLTDAMRRGQIDLVAPTSDVLSFAVAEVHDRLGLAPAGYPTPDAVRGCLFKDWFAERMAKAGFPAAPSATPTTAEEALAAAADLGYPVMLKPRSHVAVGVRRGDVAGTPERLAAAFSPFSLGREHETPLRHNPGLALPLVQRYFPRDEVDVVSISGYLRSDGEVSAGHARKLREWGRGRGTGTRFEALPEQAFTERALDAVRTVLGTGLFELEVLVHHPTGDLWAIDLNPRAYGQISLEIARGNDLPVQWYEGATGQHVGSRARRRRVPPRYWEAGLLHYTDVAVSLVRGPERARVARDAVRSLGAARVGAVSDLRDPLPALAFSVEILRHPGGMVRPFLRDAVDAEVASAGRTSPPPSSR